MLLQDPNKLKKNPPGGPPQPGLIWKPSTHRWVRPRAGAPGLHSTINPGLLRTMGDRELEGLKAHVRTNIRHERNQERFNDLTRVMRQVVDESKRRQVNKVLKKAIKLAKRLDVQGVLGETTVMLKGMTIESAIPLEQIRGDLSRAGHVIKSIIALDPESRRIFFTDTDNNALYCAFSGPEDGFKVQKVGYQAEIAKEYDVQDLEPDDSEESVSTEHEEREGNNDAGIIPAGTPGEKPERNEQEYEDAGQFGEGLGDEGFGTENRHEGRRDELKALMTQVKEQLEKSGPPRPGLVPQSGDPEHPDRWILPAGNEDVAPVKQHRSPGKRGRPGSRNYRREVRQLSDDELDRMIDRHQVSVESAKKDPRYTMTQGEQEQFGAATEELQRRQGPRGHRFE